MKLVVLLVVLGSLLSCKHTVSSVNDAIEVISEFSGLQDWIDAHSDQTLVINFWATSCPPCLGEMPHFHKLDEEYPDNDVKVLLVSLDQADHLDSRVYPFVEKHNITPEVILLADINYSSWTDEIDESWYGALPATVIIRGDQRNFRFGAYSTYEELEGDVKTVMGL